MHNSGQEYDVVLWTLSGDASAMDSDKPRNGYPGVANNLTEWRWNYVSGTGTVDFGVNSSIVPLDYSQAEANIANPLPAPGLVVVGWGLQVATGTGIPSIVGTVTIAANTIGAFEGGALLLPGVDGFLRAGLEDTTATFSTASFTVASEPSAALLVGIGLVGLAARQRRSN